MMNDNKTNILTFSVTDLSLALKQVIEERFDYVCLHGEISGFKRHSSGHCYFALKDADALIDAVMWKGNISKLSFSPQDGLAVRATGKVTLYAGRSKYQIIVDSMQPDGVGSLMMLFENLKKQLTEEGLFKNEYKKPLPYLPKVIAIITSPTGAVIRDILHRLQDRYMPHIYIFPVAVQGDMAAKQISYALRFLNKLTADNHITKPDVIIIARGGGSIEDLWAFNEEILVRSIFASDIPVISAIGHETDISLCDFVADKRCPTPTAAAEMVVPVKMDLLKNLHDLEYRLYHAKISYFNILKTKLQDLETRFPSGESLFINTRQRIDLCDERLRTYIHHIIIIKKSHFDKLSHLIRPTLIQNMLMTHKTKIAFHKTHLTHIISYFKDYHKEKLQRNFIDLQNLNNRLFLAQETFFKMKRHTILGYENMLNSLSYENVLKRGFAVIRDDTNIITSMQKAQKAKTLHIEFADGIISLKNDIES